MVEILADAPPRSGIVKPLPRAWFRRLGTNAEMRWESAREHGMLTPNDRFFVRNHTSTPRVDADTWRLRVFGDGVERELTLGLSELLKLESCELTAVMECAGSGRRHFGDAPGVQWGLGAIGAARWRGVRLADVLERAGIRCSAVDVMPVGLDDPYVCGGVDYGPVRRPLPVAKAMHDVLLAYEMNGELLPPDHGFPLRMVVPGWLGAASIKWLGAIGVSCHPLRSPWNTKWYRVDGEPLAEQPVRSAFELTPGARLRHGETLHGRAWSGVAPIRRVDVSADGGATWRRAQLRSGPRPWTRWEAPFLPRRRGRVELIARAADEAGRVQPDSVPRNEHGYGYWAAVRHPVVAV